VRHKADLPVLRNQMTLLIIDSRVVLFRNILTPGHSVRAVVLNLFHCWDPLNATDVVWDPQVKIEKVCAPE